MKKLIAVGIKRAGNKVIEWIYDLDAFRAIIKQKAPSTAKLKGASTIATQV